MEEGNRHLGRWCYCEGFGFFDHSKHFRESGLLAQGGIHLASRGRAPLSARMADLLHRALT